MIRVSVLHDGGLEHLRGPDVLDDLRALIAMRRLALARTRIAVYAAIAYESPPQAGNAGPRLGELLWAWAPTATGVAWLSWLREGQPVRPHWTYPTHRDRSAQRSVLVSVDFPDAHPHLYVRGEYAHLQVCGERLLDAARAMSELEGASGVGFSVRLTSARKTQDVQWAWGTRTRFLKAP